MKYRLKDKELQKKLDNISGGDFSVQLQKVSDDILSSLTGPGVHFGGLARVIDDRFRNLAPRFTFRFHKDEVEEVPQYDPSTWNEWPNVNPPAHVLMRVEILTQRFDQDGPEPRGGRPRFRGCAKFDGQYWDFKDMAHLSAGETVRFRPWEDKE